MSLKEKFKQSGPHGLRTKWKIPEKIARNDGTIGKRRRKLVGTKRINQKEFGRAPSKRKRTSSKLGRKIKTNVCAET